jgi:hypothetical protein
MSIMLTEASPEFITMARGVAAKAWVARPRRGSEKSARRAIMPPL